MSSFGRFWDIFTAFMGMFILPLVFLNYEAVNRIRSSSLQRAEAFLEITANAGEISNENLNDLFAIETSGKIDCKYELTVNRNEYFPDNPEKTVPVNFSFAEILSLLNSRDAICLRAGDRVTVKVYAMGLFGQKTYLLSESGKTI